jgi:hypothetical protein
MANFSLWPKSHLPFFHSSFNNMGFKDKFKLRLSTPKENERLSSPNEQDEMSPKIHSPNSKKAKKRAASFAFEKQIVSKPLSTADSDSSTLAGSLTRSPLPLRSPIRSQSNDDNPLPLRSPIRAQSNDDNPFRSVKSPISSKTFNYPSPTYQLTSSSWFSLFQDIVSDSYIQPLIQLGGRTAADR